MTFSWKTTTARADIHNGTFSGHRILEKTKSTDSTLSTLWNQNLPTIRVWSRWYTLWKKLRIGELVGSEMALILPITREQEKRKQSINRIQAYLAQTPHNQHLLPAYQINQQLLQLAMALSTSLYRSKYDSNMTMILSFSPIATRSLTQIKLVSSTKFALLQIKTRYVKPFCAGLWPAMMLICWSLQISCLTQ